ncbi:MAG: Isoleucyl-tRNA synthetase [Candidatus Daviesbacteria bacterium GW2011_GWA1_41_61]|uniref:Isoleucine--tRNA ligase n=1 Tax=Candidatus Daviesbacteria bacterium GW2011_GWA2_40_9 TaxID=1618424 RepID=A0A0G0X5P8_9BACT|nr:MAG: Isoleucyl-tRNA synthetase [Candidatus Daviesbacteria bacterium GW2011_GWC1_40_9]KKR82972.1 MAG: Isoleucyl-tRNA synthetase [Candidatus Daviesbacteria bacterium GW2011_GWA2_40_9]KKR92899.1 MAG: Isoleucyl-tRNA synthetase [Candidatus Daviesbacteria bacterium GW2011_GWB1_41_15]KKS15443.1 MAG: Isoleucyl-tRNA synthetase [Candidatus Daviesbacteria bacterium GW2011_GWA1_41_61]
MTRFKLVSSQVDFPALERELLDYWYKQSLPSEEGKEGIVEKYLHKNDSSDKKFSFLDGPITANNPMGVHHAWGRTYKDLWQRFYNMRGFAQRFQNGFDEQGLWVEVGVEKDLGLKDKKDIENLIPGDKFASIEKFVNLCKERVKKYSSIQTEQSKRLGYFMDWEHSYHTSSEQNNYAIWNFLKVVNEKGWLYKGYDSVPWCPRCGTAISQHEILTEEYKELTHDSVFVEYPIVGKENEYILVWTTTPWTLPANVAVVVDPGKDYVAATGKVKGNIYYLGKEAVARLKLDILKNLKGLELVGLEYSSPFDHLPRVQKALSGYQHQVIATDPVILPVIDEEGTGLVHIAPGAGSEDFQLGKKNKLPIIEVIDEGANYLDGMDDFSGKNAKNNPELIIDFLKSCQEGKFLFDVVPYTHRYPTCWRCQTELVWRVVDEWYIEMDRKDESGQTYREQMIEVAKKIIWLPKWGLDRELDWLKNMHDWLISKKRYWGLALPIWECLKCGHFETVGSKEELKEKALEGWEKFEGHSPHKPWIDEIKIKCGNCGELTSRIPDVGNPWLDAGIVPFSTLPEDWFPADFVTEAFPGQFKNWFYSMIAMSTALKKTNPFENLLGHAMVMDERGEEMHKSKGNAIEFNEAADKIGVDVMRWLYVTQNPEHNLHFGFNVADEVRRRFYLILWNCYKFFVEYALLSEWEITKKKNLDTVKLTILDRWIVAKLNQLALLVNKNLEKYDAMTSSRAIEDFVVSDLSTWYIRRSRDRVGAAANPEDQEVFLNTAYHIFVALSKLLAPFIPFVAEEMYRNLTGETSVHLADYPQSDEAFIDDQLIKNMDQVRKLAEIGHSLRKKAGIKLRQPLQMFTYYLPEKLSDDLEKILADELNVKKVEYQKSSEKEPQGKLDTNITPSLQSEGEARELIRQIQQQRKEAGLTLKDKVRVVSPFIPEDKQLFQMVLSQTNSVDLTYGDQLKIEVL